MTGFATSDLRDAQDQIVQLNSANELIWAADGTRLPGYRTNSLAGGHRHQFIEGKICRQAVRSRCDSAQRTATDVRT